LSRYFDIETDIALASAKKEFAALAELMPKDDPAIFNQAIWSLRCNVPKSPDCTVCVLIVVVALQKKSRSVTVKSKR
jgi:A/G-specific adenine glycosylase